MSPAFPAHKAMNTKNIYDLCDFRRKRLFGNYWNFYSQMSVPMLTDCVLDYNKELRNLRPSEKLLIEGLALFSFISSMTVNPQLKQLSDSRVNYLYSILTEILGYEVDFGKNFS